MGWSWESTVMETEKPEKTMERMVDLELVENKSDLKVVDDQNVHTEHKWDFNRYYPIRYKKLLRLRDLVDRVAILENKEYSKPKVTFLKLEENKVREVEIISCGNFSFLKDYFYQKYGLKIIPNLITDKIHFPDDIDLKYEKFEDFDQLLSEYKDIDFEEQNLKEKYLNPKNNFRRPSSYYRIKDSDYFYKANSEVVQELISFFQEEGFELHSDSMLHYFEMSVSYDAGTEGLTPYLIPIQKVKDNFTDEELMNYIKDLTEKEESSRNYLDNDFLLEDNIRGGMNYPPNPNSLNLTEGSYEICINEKSFGELQCSIIFRGNIEFEEMSKRNRSMILFTYSWLPENPEKELENLQEICKLPLTTLISIRTNQLLRYLKMK